MKFSQLCVAGALTLEVLSRGVNFASALKHDASKETTTTHLMRKDTQVLKNTEMKESFMASHGHRAIEEDVNLNWEPSAENLWKTEGHCIERGLSMSGDGKTFAITCKEHNSNTGMVKVYSLVDGQWTQKGEDIVGQKGNEQLGNSVALSGEGSILAIGIKYRSFADKNYAGCIEVYEYGGNGWTLMGEQIEGQNEIEFFGEKVSLSADGQILAGSGNLSGNGYTGFVRTFHFVEEGWKPLGSEISGQNNFDRLGYSLSLSENGKVMALGSPNTDIGAELTGSFSVYQYDDISGGWVPIGGTIHGDDTKSRLGYSIQISGDASTVIVGAYLGKFAIVYRYNENENQWKQIGEKLSPTPSEKPSMNPSEKPSMNPSSIPIEKPSSNPTSTSKPSSSPTSDPTSGPTSSHFPTTSQAILPPLSVISESSDIPDISDDEFENNDCCLFATLNNAFRSTVLASTVLGQGDESDEASK